MATTCPAPLVIVEGFLSCAGALGAWGHFEPHVNYSCQSKGEGERRTIFASVGIVSSFHDRACELFYALVGGTVDYGETHSRESGHSRFGRTLTRGLYPEWSSARPLHFLGHSIGGPTLIKLQWLIATGFFGERYHPDMILSISAVSAPFRGTQMAYILGEDVRDAPHVRPLSAGNVITKIVHVAAYLSPILSLSCFDLHAEGRGLSLREASFLSFLRQLWWSDWAESRDVAPYDATFAAADEREAAREGEVHPNTYYRSYVATMAEEPTLLWRVMNWPFWLASRVMVSFRFADIRPVPGFLDPKSPSLEDVEIGIPGKTISALRANDSVVPLFSQWHPHDCKSTRCKHYSHSESVLDGPLWEKSRYDLDERRPDAGVWHVHHLKDAHHFSIAPVWLALESQKAFWTDLGHWLRAVDGERADRHWA